jgi:hypothetical protein
MRAAAQNTAPALVPTAERPARAPWVAGMVAAVLALPPVIYALLAWRQAGFLNVTWYVPYEELAGALASGELRLILEASAISVNMTSGDILANMYQLTVEQMLLSVALGTAVGLTLDAQLRLTRACAPAARGGSAAAAGSGLAATVAASSTGILGCCGSGLAGGVLALAGVTGAAAAYIAEYSYVVQLVLIAAFAFAYRRFARRLKAGAS